MIFINNKYTSIYYSIITNAKSRINPKEVYTEKHHIIPKSLGGANSVENYVRLTAREHFICHWLLTKMTESQAKHKMLYALNGMRQDKTGNRYNTKITSKVYANTKGKRKTSEETKLKISLAKQGIPRTEETKQKMRNRIVTAETRHKQSQSLKGRVGPNLGKPRTEETKEKIKNSLSGRTLSEEAKAKLRGPRGPAKVRGPQPIVVCPHCLISGGIVNMKRYHFLNCATLIF